MSSRKTNIQFISDLVERGIKITPLDQYTTRNGMMNVMCGRCGNIWNTCPRYIYSGRHCPVCGLNKRLFDEVLIDFRAVHGSKYTYDNNSYVNMTTKIQIYCPIHGYFNQTPSSHRAGNGCRKCQYDASRKDLNILIDEFNLVHYGLYDYSCVKYMNNHTNIDIICQEHGTFQQTPSNHKAGNGCPSCIKSNGERIIEKFLIDNNIKFTDQQTYDSLRSDRGRLLRFDFHIPADNLIIEYDGRQHGEYIPSFQTEDDFLKLQYHDRLKNDYCICNNIILVRINYNDNIDDKLREIFK